MTSHCTLLLLKLCSIWSSSPQRLVHGCNYSTTTSSGIVSGGQRSRATTGAAASRPQISSSHSVYHFSSVTFVSWMMTVCWLGWHSREGIQLNAAYFELLLNSIENRIALLKLTSNLSFATWLFIRPRIIVIHQHCMAGTTACCFKLTQQNTF